MKQYEFNYNKQFSCIADKCKHNCCIGWQIDVDRKAFMHYQTLKERDNRFDESNFLNNSFNLDSNLHCPFLDGDNLCHIIKNYGEKALCKTCKTHPRFKNFFNGVTETGLGLYCEHACKIILSSRQKMKLNLVKDDGLPNKLKPFEKKVIAFRKKVARVLQDRKISIAQRIAFLNQLSGIDLTKKSFSAWLDTFCGLERLKVNEFSFCDIKKAQDFAQIQNGFELEYEQILCYLAFRHLSRAIDALDLRVRLAFVLLCFNMINHIFSLSDKKDINTLIETCRFFSSEIETSDDNIFAILNEIENLVSFI